jgi:chemotaxis protein MotB
MPPLKRKADDGEFLWLVSLSDLMILLFIFFVVMFSFSMRKVNKPEFQQLVAEIRKDPSAAANPADQMKRDFEQVARDQGLSDEIEVRRQDNSVLVEIRDKVLFGSGEFLPHQNGTLVLQRISHVLAKVPSPYRIGIEGHTDDVPIHTARIQDNWDLSARRALAVMHALQLPPDMMKRVVVMANGEMSPIAPNRDPLGRALPENQSRNRRVTLRIF